MRGLSAPRVSTPRVARPDLDGLPLRERWYPMGHPVEIVTNSAAVLSIADGLWHEYPPISRASAIELRIEVSSRDRAPHRPAQTFQLDRFFAVVSGSQNFAIADMNLGLGIMRVGAGAARDAPWFAYHFLEPLAYTLLGVRHFTMIHASAVALGGAAAILCGGSGAGKTCLAYACARRGWTFLTGDATHLVRDAPQPAIIGRPFSIRFRASARNIFPELRRFAAIVRPNGKRDFELDPRRLGLSVAVEARPGLIVFLNRVANLCRPSIKPVSRSQARGLLSEWICLGSASIRAEQRRTLEKLLERPAVRLTYSDPFAAEDLLRWRIAAAG